MAKNRKNQAAAIRFGPALKAAFLCLLIGGTAVGYVWQKGEIYRLGQQISQREIKLKQLRNDNKRLSEQVSILHSPPLLDQRVKELNLGLGPMSPLQVVRLNEPPLAKPDNLTRQFTQRSMNDLMP